MASSCSKSKRVKGLFFKVLSSADGMTPVDAIGDRRDVKHWVAVENLGGYPADLECRGRIPAHHPAIRFDSKREGDTAMVWTDSYSQLPDGVTRTFSHVTLLPNICDFYPEIIHADLKLIWPQAVRERSITLNIQVSP